VKQSCTRAVQEITSRGFGAQAASSPQVRGSAFQQPRRDGLAMRELLPHSAVAAVLYTRQRVRIADNRSVASTAQSNCMNFKYFVCHP